jgi:hypothetical protein
MLGGIVLVAATLHWAQHIAHPLRRTFAAPPATDQAAQTGVSGAAPYLFILRKDHIPNPAPATLTAIKTIPGNAAASVHLSFEFIRSIG